MVCYLESPFARSSLTTTRSESDSEASRSLENLRLLVDQVLLTNQELRNRMKAFEDVCYARSTTVNRLGSLHLQSQKDDESITTIRQPNKRVSILESIKARFAFEEDLKTSRVYNRAALREGCDYSFISSAVRTNAWSILSGLSLADISKISVLSLPIFLADITNNEHYSFGIANSTQLAGSPSQNEHGPSWVQTDDPSVNLHSLDVVGEEDELSHWLSTISLNLRSYDYANKKEILSCAYPGCTSIFTAGSDQRRHFEKKHERNTNSVDWQAANFEIPEMSHNEVPHSPGKLAELRNRKKLRSRIASDVCKGCGEAPQQDYVIAIGE
jgi:hypothetical protein